MRTVHSFPGGIHPPERKSLSNQTAIRRPALPPCLYLPLRQALGINAIPLVKTGDRVLAGQLIADTDHWQGLPVHASTSGIVRGVEARLTDHPSAIAEPCLVIDVDGEDEWVALNPLPPEQQNTKNLIHRIRESGICGAGGAGFPTHIKLSPAQQTLPLLIVNGMECEPYITADDVLMQERAHHIVEGIEIATRILGCTEVLIGIEDNKLMAFQSIKRAIAGKPYQLMIVPTKYPSGGEKQIIQLLTGQEVPSGKLPADIGMVCLNVGTLCAIADAVLRGRPMVSRITTLTGLALDKPGNIEALIGTPIAHLLAEGGVRQQDVFRLILGGPMMGVTLSSSDIPVTKTSQCVLAATASELPPLPPEQPCIRCGECAVVCPASLLPQQLYWFSKAGEHDKAQHHNIMDCIECGACSYVCPSHIPLVQYYRHTKGAIHQHRAELAKADRARQRFEFRNARLEQEHADKETRRTMIRMSEAPAPTPAVNPDGLAHERILKANLNKHEKLLRDAEAAFEEASKRPHSAQDSERMKASLNTLRSAYEEAYQAWHGAQPNAVMTPGLDKKNLTVQSALKRTEIRKLEKALSELPLTAPQEEREAIEQQLKTARDASEKLITLLATLTPKS